MPKPIIITEQMKAIACEEFTKLLANVKMSDGKISYSKSFKYNDSTATIWLTQTALRKIITLVTSFSDEVAWHGTVSRLSDDEFIIEDVFVYPQIVSSSTVNTDWDQYTEWLYGFSDEDFNKIRMQGHSHVNMGVSPSGVDNSHRAEILKQLEADMFYIFMIWNKSLNIHTLVYDLQRNVLFEDDDIEVKILDDELMGAFLSDAIEKVQKKKATKYKVKRYGEREAVSQYSLRDYYGYYDDLYGLNKLQEEYYS